VILIIAKIDKYCSKATVIHCTIPLPSFQISDNNLSIILFHICFKVTISNGCLLEKRGGTLYSFRYSLHNV
jgi:hypothetical protein